MIKNSCVACKSEIIPGAIICPVCKIYQSGWKSRLQYFAAIAGSITVITGFIALLTYVGATWPEVRKVIFWRDRLEVTSFDSESSIVISNFGDGEIFVSHLVLSSEKPMFAESRAINISAKAKSFISLDFGEVSGWGTVPLSEKAWQEVLKIGKDDCFKWNFFDANNPHYHNLKKYFGDNFRSLPLVAHLIFYSGSDGRRMSKDFPIYAVPVFKITTKECKDKLGLH